MAKGIIYTALGTQQPYLYYTNATGGTVDSNFNNLATAGCLLDGTTFVQEAWEVSTLILDELGRPDLCNIIAGKHYVRATTADTEGSQTKNTVFASPDGTDGVATFRALVSADLPAITSVGTLDVTATSNQFVVGTTHTTTLSLTAPASSLTYTFPDAGGAANVMLTEGNQTATGTLTINKAALTTTSVDGLLLENTTASTSGVAVQVSPALHFDSHVWNTTATAADNTFDARTYFVPVSGTTPTGSLVWEMNNNGGGWVQKMSLNDSGVLGTTELALTKTTAQVTLGASSHKTIITSPAPAGASQTLTIPDQGGASTFVLAPAIQDITGDGAITIPGGMYAAVNLSKGSAAAITLAAPTSGTDDGKIIEVFTSSAFAHVITSSVDGFNAKGSSGTATFANAIGNAVKFFADDGHWYAVQKNGVTIA